MGRATDVTFPFNTGFEPRVETRTTNLFSTYLMFV